MKAINNWNENLKSKNGRKEMFKIAKNMKSDNKDLRESKYIKNANGELIVKEMLDRWRNYFEKLLNKMTCYYTDEVDKVEGPLQNVTVDEILKARKEMRNKKTAGPLEVTSDLIKMTKEIGENQLRRIFEQIIFNKKCF